MPEVGRRAWRRWSRWDAAIGVPVVLLVLFGALTVYSATALCQGGHSGLIVRHLIAIGLGVLLGAFLARLPPRGLDDLSPLLYAGAMLLLLLVLVVGESSGGARRWLSIGPIRLQPAEPAKLAFLLFYAHLLARKRFDLDRLGPLALALLVVAVPFFLVLREPDLGTALAFPAVGAFMLLWAGLPWLTFYLLASPLVTGILSGLRFVGHASAWLWGILWIPFVAAGALALRRRGLGWVPVSLFILLQLLVAFETPRLYKGLAPYQQARVSAFVSPERDPDGAGYQVIQSRIAIGSGCLAGRGFGKGSQKALAFLPRQHTDFIYSVVGEEWGFLGAALVLMLYAILLMRMLALARAIRTRFGSLLAVGVAALTCYHTVVNIGMTLGLAPVTGLPLPFLSFGGSFLITMLAAVGLFIGVAARRTEY